MDIARQLVNLVYKLVQGGKFISKVSQAGSTNEISQSELQKFVDDMTNKSFTFNPLEELAGIGISSRVQKIYLWLKSIYFYFLDAYKELTNNGLDAFLTEQQQIDFLAVIEAVAFTMILVLFFYHIFMFALLKERDSVIAIILRSLVSLLLMVIIPAIIVLIDYYIIEIFNATNNLITIEDTNIVEDIFSVPLTALSRDNKNFISILFILVIGYNFIKLAVEFIKNFVLSRLLIMFSPLSAPFFVTQHSSDVITKFFSLFGTTGAIYIFNYVFLTMTISIINQGTLSFMKFLQIMAILQIGVKIEAILFKLGFNPASVGGTLLDSIVGTTGVMAMVGARALRLGKSGVGALGSGVGAYGAIKGDISAMNISNALRGVRRSPEQTMQAMINEPLRHFTNSKQISDATKKSLADMISAGNYRGVSNIINQKDFMTATQKADFINGLESNLFGKYKNGFESKYKDKGYKFTLDGFDRFGQLSGTIKDQRGNVLERFNISETPSKTGSIRITDANGNTHYINTIDKDLAKKETQTPEFLSPSHAFEGNVYNPDNSFSRETGKKLDEDMLVRNNDEIDNDLSHYALTRMENGWMVSYSENGNEQGVKTIGYISDKDDYFYPLTQDSWFNTDPVGLQKRIAFENTHADVLQSEFDTLSSIDIGQNEKEWYVKDTKIGTTDENGRFTIDDDSSYFKNKDDSVYYHIDSLYSDNEKLYYSNDDGSVYIGNLQDGENQYSQTLSVNPEYAGIGLYDAYEKQLATIEWDDDSGKYIIHANNESDYFEGYGIDIESFEFTRNANGTNFFSYEGEDIAVSNELSTNSDSYFKSTNDYSFEISKMFAQSGDVIQSDSGTRVTVDTNGIFAGANIDMNYYENENQYMNASVKFVSPQKVLVEGYRKDAGKDDKKVKYEVLLNPTSIDTINPKQLHRTPLGSAYVHEIK